MIKLSGPDFHKAYTASVASGKTITEFAEEIGMKQMSVVQRLTKLRNVLRQKGATDEQLKAIFPPLKRRGNAASTNDFLDSLLAQVRTP